MFKEKEWHYVDNQITVSAFALYRLERAKQDLDDAEFSYENHR